MPRRAARNGSKRALFGATLTLALVVSSFVPSLANGQTVTSSGCSTVVGSNTGVITATSGGWCYVGFTNSGSNSFTVPSGISSVQLLIIAGGGAGGAGAWGGGGGAGELVVHSDYSVTPGNVIPISVGAGGTSGAASLDPAQNRSNNGNDSWVASSSAPGVVAIGGGAGASYAYSSADSLTKGNNGGSGGGGTEHTNANNTGGSALASSAGSRTGYGFAGGNGTAGAGTQGSGGGGGSGAAGANGGNGIGGAGGQGSNAASTWLAAISSVMGAGWQSATSAGRIAAGGGGGTRSGGTAGVGGTGGGGAGSNTTGTTNGTAGVANTGSGGGGASHAPSGLGGAGGSGLVVFRFAPLPAAPTITNVVSTATQATLTWSAPTDTGGGTISNYSFEYSTDNGATWTPFTRTPSTSTTQVITGLTNSGLGGSRNQYRIKTITNFGSSSPSTAVNGWYGNCDTEPTPSNDDRDRLNEAVNLRTFVTFAGCSILNTSSNMSLTSASTYVFDPATAATGTISIYDAGFWGFEWTLRGQGDRTLVPQFSISESAESATISITNFDASFNWSVSSNGCTAIRSTATISVSNYTKRSCNIQVTTSKSGWGTGQANAYTGASRHSVRYQAPSATGTMADQTSGSGATVTISANSFTRSGYTFNGWNTLNNGTGTSYAVGSSFTLTSSLNLWAQWTGNSLTVAWNAKGGSSVSDTTVATGATLGAPTPPTRAGYTFAGWSATDGGTAVTFPYTHGQTANFTMYAIWTANNNNVVYDEKGGSTVTDGTFLTGGTVTFPSSPTRAGFIFGGWSATDGGNPVSAPYSPTDTSNITLYAVWLAVSPPTGVTATAGNQSVTVGWTAPANSASQPPTAYRVEYSTTGSGGWTTADATISSSARTYQITGLTNSTAYYVRVGAVYAGVTGAYGYPWTLIFETTTPSRVSEAVPYTSTNGLSDNDITLSRTDFSRVRYYVGARYPGDTSRRYVDANFDKTISSPGLGSDSYTNLFQLQVPRVTGGSNSQFEIQGNVSDLDVLTNSAAVNQGVGLSGRLEIWPWNYSFEPQSGLSGGQRDAGKYDDGDSWTANSGNYGSFQLHNIGSSPQTIFAWNLHIEGFAPIIGFGTNTGTHPDWTFESVTRTDFLFQSYANLSVTPLANYTITLNRGTNGTGSDQTLTKTHGQALTLPNSASANSSFTRTGYTVTGWSTTDGGSQTHALGASFTTDATTTLYPVWTGNTYTVTYTYNSADGGTRPATSNFTVGGSAITLPTPTRTGHTFDGWFAEVGLATLVGAAGASYSPTTNTTLYAKWITNALAPTISSQPISRARVANESVTFSVSASVSDGGSLTYQWQKDNVDISGATSTSYTINSAASADAGTYRVIVTNSKSGTTTSTTSNGARLSVAGVNYHFDAVSSSPGSASATGRSFRSSSAVLPAGSFTIEGWVRDKSTSTGQNPIFSQGSNGTNRLTLHIIGTTNRTLWLPGTTASISGSTVMAKDKWHHYAVTYDGTTLRLYLNGALEGSVNDTLNLTGTFFIGENAFYSGSNSAHFFHGKQDQVKIWSGALSQSDIAASMYSYGNAGITDKTLRTLYDFDQRNSSTVSDVLGGFDLTSNGSGTSTTWPSSSLNATFDEQGGSAVTDTTFDFYTRIASPSTTRANATFSGWSRTSTGSVVSFPYSFVPMEDITLYGIWVMNTYSITLNKGASGNGTNQALTKTHGQALTLPDLATANSYFTRTGYTVSGWSTTDGGSQTHALGGSFTTEAATTLYPVWTGNTYTVTYQYNSADGGTRPATNTFTVGGSAISLPTPTRAGYTFDGWYAEVGLATLVGAAGASYSPSTSTTIYAKWTLGTLNITFDANGGSTVSTSTVNFGSAANKPSDPTKSGFRFAGWSTSETSNQGDIGNRIRIWPYTPSTNLTLYAIWVDDYSLALTGNQRVSARVGTDPSRVAVLPDNSSFSWEAWIYPTGVSGTGGTKFATVLDNLDPLNNYGRTWLYIMDSGSGPYISAAYYGSGVTEEGANATTSANSISYNNWQHVAVTIERAGGAAASCVGTGTLTIRVYINGVLLQTATDNSFSRCLDSIGFSIGDNFDDANQQFKGRIDQVKVWDGTLTQSEVQSSMANFGVGSVDNTLRAHYTFDDLPASPASGSFVKNQVSDAGTYDLQLFSTNAADVANNNASRILNSFTLAFDGNSPTSGSVASITDIRPYGSSTVAGQGTLLKTNNSFTGWNTAANGSGTSYAAASSFTTLYGDSILYATWQVQQSTVTFNANDGSGTPAASTQSINNGVATALTSNTFTRTGYTFAGWNTLANGTGTNYTNQQSVTLTGNLTLYAKWTANTYTVTYEYNGADGGNTPVTSSFTVGGSAITLPTPTRTGYTFAGWYGEIGLSTLIGNAGASYSPTANVTIYAKWTANSNTVTFKSNYVGGANDTTQSIVTAVATGLTSNTFTRTGYTFSGWNTLANGTGTNYTDGQSVTLTGGLTLYAKWTVATYTVTYNYNSATGGNSAPSGTFTTGGSNLVLPTPTRTGYTFAGWYDDSGFSGSALASSISTTSSKTIYAKWTAATYTVLYEYNGATGGNTTVSNDYTTASTTITLPTPTRTGYTFAGWFEASNLTGSAATTPYTTSQNRSLYAKWTAVNYTVTYNANLVVSGNTIAGTGSVPVNNNTYNIGQSFSVAANTGPLTRSGYTFAGWVTNQDGSGTAKNSGETITFGAANINLYPKWTANTYTISYNLNGGSGDLTTAPTSWTVGNSNVTLPSSGFTRTGYNFAGWSMTQGGAVIDNSFSNIGNVTLYAAWTLKSISYTFDKGTAAGQTIASWPSNSSANFGSTITLPTPGNTVTINSVTYQFFGWEYSGTTYQPGSSFTLSETGPTFVAQWVRLFDVRYAYAGGTHSVAGDTDDECVTGGLCLQDQDITLRTAPTRSGYNFIGWRVQDTNTTKAAGAAHRVIATGYLFYANWQAIDYVFSFNSSGGSDSHSSVTANIGQLVTMPNPGFKVGYTFAGWSPDGGTTKYTTGSTFNVGTSSRAFVAYWTPNVYTVVYDWQGASGTPTPDASYTVGTGALTLPLIGDRTKDGFTFGGWSETPGGTTAVSNFVPTSNDILYAIWNDGNYTLSYNGQGASAGSGSGSVGRGQSVTLPTPVRAGFVFNGWYDAATGGNKIGNGGQSHTPDRSKTMHARWVQKSLWGVDPAKLESANEYTASDSTGVDTTLTHNPSGTSAQVRVPAGALPNGTKVNVQYFKDTDRQSALIPGDNSYFFSVLVSWLSGTGSSATVPNTNAGKAIEVTLTNSQIKAGAMVYMVIGDEVRELGRATQDGTVTVNLTEDPEIVVAATAPGTVASVVASSGDQQATISWAAPSTNGGAQITGYTVTASPGGANCTTATTSCTVTGLNNGTAYTFSVVANNSVGSSSGVSSSSITPALATYTVSFNSNGGSNVSNGTFTSGGSVSEPTAPTRSGYTFDGWSTVLNSVAAKVTFPYTPGVTNNITLYALWTQVQNNNSGGGGGQATPTPTPTVTPGPTAPPSQIGFRPTPPATPVAVTGPVGTVTGSTEKVTVVADAPSEKIIATAGSWKFEIKPPVSEETEKPVSEKLALQLPVGSKAEVSGAGLQPNTTVEAWVFSEPRYLTTIKVGSDGSFASSLSLPKDLLPGQHTLQIGSLNGQGRLVVLSVPITIKGSVSVGTFRGFVAIFTKDLEGQELTAKVAGKWIRQNPIRNFKRFNYSRLVRLTGAGYDIAIDVYINKKFYKRYTTKTR